jgi:hypothetical protein
MNYNKNSRVKTEIKIGLAFSLLMIGILFSVSKIQNHIFGISIVIAFLIIFNGYTYKRFKQLQSDKKKLPLTLLFINLSLIIVAILILLR